MTADEMSDNELEAEIARLEGELARAERDEAARQQVASERARDLARLVEEMAGIEREMVKARERVKALTTPMAIIRRIPETQWNPAHRGKA